MTNPTKLYLDALEARAKLTVNTGWPSSMSVSPFAVLQLVEAARERDALKAAAKSILHLIKPSDDDYPRTDMLEGLPDSHLFELTWAPEKCRHPTITAGQLRRMRDSLTAITNQG